MTDHEKEIIEEYRKGDFEKRLFLFLRYRYFRSQFIRIDLNEKKLKRGQYEQIV